MSQEKYKGRIKMKNIMTKRLGMILCLLMLTLSLTAISLPVKTVSAYTTPSENMTIRFYDLKAEVDAARTVTMEETIGVNFAKSYVNVGMFWSVSRVNKITRVVNGKKYSTKTIAKLSGVEVTLNGLKEYFFMSDSSNYFIINTGHDNDYKKAGDHVFKIKYIYELGYDYIKDFDDFTFDIFPFGIKACPEASATVSLPYELSSDALDKVVFRKNIDGGHIDPVSDLESISGFGYQYNITDKTFNIRAVNLNENSGLTLQTIMEEGYYNLSKFIIDPWYIVVCILVFLLVAAAIVLAVLYRFKKPKLTVVEFYPPNGMTPVEMAQAVRGRVRYKDIAMLVLKWANEKRISVKAEGKHLRLTRLAGGERGLPIIEGDYFAALLKKGSVTTEELNKMPRKDPTQAKALTKAVEKIKSTAEKNEVWAPRVEKVKIIFYFLAMLPYSIASIYSMVTAGQGAMAAVLIFSFAGTGVFYFIKDARPILTIFLVGFNFPAMGYLIAIYLPLLDFIGISFIALLNFIFCIITGLGFIGKRNEQNMKQLERVYGFKNFLLHAEKEKLEMMIEESPNYFFDILPYCYVLGITNKMKKKFEDIAIAEMPDWYSSGISVGSFVRTISSSVSAGSGGRGGGGGGSGGGGGGSSGGGGGGR